MPAENRAGALIAQSKSPSPARAKAMAVIGCRLAAGTDNQYRTGLTAMGAQAGNLHVGGDAASGKRHRPALGPLPGALNIGAGKAESDPGRRLGRRRQPSLLKRLLHQRQRGSYGTVGVTKDIGRPAMALRQQPANAVDQTHTAMGTAAVNAY